MPPSAALAAAVRLACPRDVFPFSDTPSPRCQLDHDVPWPLGLTELSNPTTREWTSPTGRRHLVDHDGTWTHPDRRSGTPSRPP